MSKKSWTIWYIKYNIKKDKTSWTYSIYIIIYVFILSFSLFFLSLCAPMLYNRSYQYNHITVDLTSFFFPSLFVFLYAPTECPWSLHFCLFSLFFLSLPAPILFGMRIQIYSACVGLVHNLHENIMDSPSLVENQNCFFFLSWHFM